MGDVHCILCEVLAVCSGLLIDCNGFDVPLELKTLNPCDNILEFQKLVMRCRLILCRMTFGVWCRMQFMYKGDIFRHLRY